MRARAGPLIADLDGADVRYVKIGCVEIVRRLTMLVRDENWGTVRPTISNRRLDVDSDRFCLSYDARNVDDARGIDFSWRGEIVGGPGPMVSCTFEGVANRSFRFNRIGWCVLHPPTNEGRRVWLQTPQGRIARQLPTHVAPQRVENGLPVALFPPFDELEIDVADGVAARFELDGDLFEIEDQRNWTDASYKTYSTPLSHGFPHVARKHQRFSQVVRLTVTCGERAGSHAPEERAVTVDVGRPIGRLPALGLGARTHLHPLGNTSTALVSDLRLDHLRVDVKLADKSWYEAATLGIRDARSLGTPLELAVVLSRDDGNLAELRELLQRERPALARVLAFRSDEPTSSAETVARVRQALGDAARTPVFGGTDLLFVDLNRFRPRLREVDGVAWPVTATVHADDDTSVAETAAMHGETIRSARRFCGDRPLAVTPITFSGRGNPDPRQSSLFAAGWTVASIRSAAEAGAASVTYFEVAGPCGVIDGDSDGIAFPAYHVLADASEWRSGELLRARSSNPLAVDVLAVDVGGRLSLLVANLTAAPQTCRINGCRSRTVELRRLDEHSFRLACADPVAFRTRTEQADAGDSLELELSPFATIRIDSPATDGAGTSRD